MIALHGKRKPVYFGKVSEVSQEDAERAYYAKMDELTEGHEHRPESAKLSQSEPRDPSAHPDPQPRHSLASI